MARDLEVFGRVRSVLTPPTFLSIVEGLRQ